MWALAGLVATATLLTFVEFPSRYFDLVGESAFPLAVVLMRDLVLVGVVALSIRALRAQTGGETTAGLSASRARAITS
jgi:hypothetical protein